VECYGGGALSKCTISGNSASNGGGVECFYFGALTNCLIIGHNSANYGGGIYLQEGGEVYNCTISSNHAVFSGGGVCCTNGGILYNSIIYHNSALQGGAEWQTYGSGAGFGCCCTRPTNDLPQYSCIPDDPLFQSVGSDYHLTEGSPCIDAGEVMSWMTGTTDLEGNPRTHDGMVDMGCYELIPEPGLVLTIAVGFLLVRRLGIPTAFM